MFDLRSIQKPLKDQFRASPQSAQIMLVARGRQTTSPLVCLVDVGNTVYQAEAHQGVGGAGMAVSSGDLFLAALAACAQITCQMVAASMGMPVDEIGVTVEGDLDLRGALGISPDAPVGFEEIRVYFDVKAPQATEDQQHKLRERTEQHCLVMQTLLRSPTIYSGWLI